MKLLICLVLLLSSILPAIPVRAEKTTARADDHVVIAQLQTSGMGSGTASEEYILLLNPTVEDITVTDWCIKYSSASDNTGFEVCMTPPDSSTDLILEAGGFVSFATVAFIGKNIAFTPDVVFSGGMSATSGHLRLKILK